MKLAMFAAATAVACQAATAAVPAYDTLIAHRGESIDAPENTLPAYKTAVERGFGFECDIYLSKDGRVFTFHDPDLKRTTAGVNTNRCGDVTWDEVSKLDVGSWGKWKEEDTRFAGTRPALLEEVLELARDGRKIYVEVKTGPKIVPYIKKVFDSQKKANPENTLFISFNPDSCVALKKAMPEYKVYLLLNCKTSWRKDSKPLKLETVLAKLNKYKPDGLDLRFDPEIVTDEWFKAVKDAGFEFHVWTLDDLDVALEAFKRGAQTVTTNCAKKLLDEYNERNAAK